MLERGSAAYHQPVLKLLYEYLKLQDPSIPEIKKISDTIMTAATQHIRVRAELLVTRLGWKFSEMHLVFIALACINLVGDLAIGL